MSHARAANSPRVKAHKLKVVGAKGNNTSPSKKNKTRRILQIETYDDDDLDSYNETLPTYDSLEGYGKKAMNARMEAPSPDKSPHGSPVMQFYSANDADLESFGHKLNSALQENSRLRSKLRVEMEEKYVLEQKVVALTDKLVEAKRSLQDTSFALQKVQLVTSQLMSKKDEREMQLQEVTLQNNSLQRRINDLERQLGDMNELHARELENTIRKNESMMAALTAAKTAQPENNNPIIESLQSELAEAREQNAQLKKENFKLMEEKQDAQYMLEAKTSRVSALEERLRAAESSRGMLDWSNGPPLASRDAYSTVPTQRPMSSGGMGGGGVAGAIGVVGPGAGELGVAGGMDVAGVVGGGDIKSSVNPLESKVVMLETDKSMLEQRLAILERQLSHPVIVAAAQMAPAIMSQVSAQHAPTNMSIQSLSPRSTAPEPLQQQPYSHSQLQHQYQPQTPQQQYQPPQQQPQQQPQQHQPQAQYQLQSPPQLQQQYQPQVQYQSQPAQQYQQQQQQLQQQYQPQAQYQPQPAQNLPQQYQPPAQYQPQQQLQQPSYGSRPVSSEVDMPSNLVANSPHAQSAGRIKRVSLPPVIEQHDMQQSPVVASARGPSINQALSGSGDIGEARLAAQMAVMQSTSTAPVVAEDQPISRGVSQSQFRRDQSMFFHEATEQPLEDAEGGGDEDDMKRKVEQEKKTAKKAIMQWYKNFVKENNREPTKVERDMYVGEVYKQYRRSSKFMKELEAKK